MKRKFIPLFLFIFLSIALPAQATILPDACGDDKVKFDVTAERSKNLPAPPTGGKAQIVFIENENHMIGPFMHTTIRFGLDGAWAGANSNNTYFVVPIEPGVHHVCVSWQSALPTLKKSIDVASFTAEPGKVYYFAANVKVIPVGEDRSTYDFSLAQLDDDAGQYRVKAWKVAKSTPR